MATVHQTDVQHQQDLAHRPGVETLPEIKIYSHSPLLYWWPVWMTGYVLALITYFQGHTVTLVGPDGAAREFLMHPSKNLGVFYTIMFTLVIVMTNVTLRGLLSVVAIISVMFFTVLFAWLGWWDDILALLPYLAIYMNLGFYVFFSTAVFIVWALAFFVFDRMNFWRVRPGQMTFERVVGGGERSYDTRGMVFEKHPSDFFRHLVLGLGSGDLRITTTGARSEEIYIPNVIFVDRKVREIQKLIAVKPDDTPDRVVTAGTPE
jgi:hypothetical protein